MRAYKDGIWDYPLLLCRDLEFKLLEAIGGLSI